MSIPSCGLGHDDGARTPARMLYTPREVQHILNVSHALLYRLINRGQLDVRKLGVKTLITAESVQRFIDELPRGIEAPTRRGRPRKAAPAAAPPPG